jgi:endonuclease/exonuclease/phosphatase family metal-dependent hydrolase
MILTRLPVISQSAQRLMAVPATPCDVVATRVAVRVELAVNNRQVQVIGTHLANTDATYRSAQLSQLATFANGLSGEKLIGADLNTLPTETALWALLAGYSDTWMDLVYNGDTGYTHHSTANTPPGKRIDYWLRSGPNLVVGEVSVLQTKRSDHNPVVLDVRIQ